MIVSFHLPHHAEYELARDWLDTDVVPSVGARVTLPIAGYGGEGSDFDVKSVEIDYVQNSARVYLTEL